jgi:hypothetical protein
VRKTITYLFPPERNYAASRNGFIDGHLVGHIVQDIGFEAFNQYGSYMGTWPTKERARRALESEPVRCEHC